MKVVLVSAHDGNSDRKTGFHFWAESLAGRGHDVYFLTAGSSYITLLKKNGKQLKRPFNKWIPLDERIRKLTWMPLFHPIYFQNKFLNIITRPFFSLYPRLFPSKLLEPLKDTTLFIVENGQGTMLVPRLAKLCPRAKFIYNPSDRRSIIKFHPVVVDAEKAALPHFAAIRLNSNGLANDFPANAPTHYIPQAIDKKLFDAPTRNPYKQPKNAINVGDMLFDAHAVETLAVAYPDWTFHLFGKGARISRPMDNVIEYGEMPFEELVPYLQYADIGLAPYKATKQASYLSQSSLKLVQYTYCKIPVVAPKLAANGAPHILTYDSIDEETIIQAFENAMRYDKKSIDNSRITGWDEVINKMMRYAHIQDA